VANAAGIVPEGGDCPPTAQASAVALGAGVAAGDADGLGVAVAVGAGLDPHALVTATAAATQVSRRTGVATNHRLAQTSRSACGI
jgi:hypothetical protein